ncbi:hypothetical protein HanPSC8_Chr16g0726531 [Helianthus annuus]|nr:hypothetical protein HanPSC8_Chr16g0726531 [Helianthus annuus]
MKCRYPFGCRKTIKLIGEPNTIKIHASAQCPVNSITLCRITYDL